MKGIKSKLLRSLPNNKEVFPINYDIIVIDGEHYILWSICREGNVIWIEMEDDSPFGVTMGGRYYLQYEDVDEELYPYILERFNIK